MIPAAGALDTSFAIDGVFSLADVKPGAQSFLFNDLAAQPDGKIVLVGDDYDVLRLNADGSLDTIFEDPKDTFDPHPFSFLGDVFCNAVALLPDGKVAAMGLVYGAIFTPDGSLESSVDLWDSETIQGADATAQTDGKLVVVGTTWPSPFSAITVLRYNSDGTSDSSFDADGKVLFHLSGPNAASEAVAVATQPDSKIVIAGSTGFASVFEDDGELHEFYTPTHHLLVRYNADGSLDSTFGAQGVVTTPMEKPPNALALLPDGKILLASGNLNGNTFTLVRYNPDGSLDNTFGTAGIVTTAITSNVSFGTAPHDIVALPDGDIIVVGATETGVQHAIAVVRYNSDGTLDANFDSDGIALLSVDFYNTGYAVTLAADGDLLVAGSIGNFNGYVAAVALKISVGFSAEITGTEINDVVLGTFTHDPISVGSGDDTVSAGTGHDSLLGGDGADWLHGNQGNDTIYGGAGADELRGGIGSDFLQGNQGSDTLTGSVGDDELRGGNDHDLLQGNQGNDTLIGSVGNDELRGGNDHDLLQGNQGNDTLIGSVGNDELRGGNDADWLYAGDGNDLLIGGPGNDTLIGVAGNDVFHFNYMGEANTDGVFDFSSGEDLIALTPGTFGALSQFAGGPIAPEYFFSAAGPGAQTTTQHVLYDTSSGVLYYDEDANGPEAATPIATLFLAPDLAASDIVVAVTTISGGAGADNLHGSNHADWMQGHDGNDTLTGLLGSDELSGGDHDDILQGNEGNDTLQGNKGNDTLIGGTGNDELHGSNEEDDLDNSLDRDLLQGNQGNDTLIGGTGADELRGGNDDDLLHGGQGPDTIIGSFGNDELHGGNGWDLLQGGDGNDLLSGGNGADTLIGGAGADVFRFDSPNFNIDYIVDFTPGEDVIEISASGYGVADQFAGGSTPDNFFLLWELSSQPPTTHFVLYRTGAGNGNGHLSFDPAPGGAYSVQPIAILIGTPNLQASDFVVV
jgi:uncharacterized delta-60 repeat protein